MELQFSRTTRKILVLVKGDWRKESQYSLTTYSILVLVKRKLAKGMSV